MNAHGVFAACSFLLYASAALASIAYLFTKSERSSRTMFFFLKIGVALHAAAFALRLSQFWTYPENRFFLPLTTFYGALSYMGLALAATFLAVEQGRRLDILGAFVLPWAAASLGAAVLLAPPDVAPLAESLRYYWLNLHPFLLMTAYAALANATGVAAAFLVQERQIKSRKPGALCYRLPSLDELDYLHARIIAWAYPVLLAGLAMGMVWAYRDGWRWGGDPKLTMAVVTAAIYGVFLWRHFIGGRRGRRPVYLSLLGFASVLATFLGAEFYSGRHSYLGGLR